MKKVVVILSIVAMILFCVAGYFIWEKQEETHFETKENIEEWKLSKFDLREKISYKEEYQVQATYKTCWAYAGFDAMETNILLHKGMEYDFSEIHAEYLTSTIFGGTRELDTGGLVTDVMDHYEKYQGPVLESQVPNRRYAEDEYDLLLKPKPIVRRVQYRSYAQNSENLLNTLKKHIVEDGVICATIHFDPLNENAYNPETAGYYKPAQDNETNHVVSIIGWDDNYPKENFKEENRPQNDGAYLVNPFWSKFGMIYIPYEDPLIHKDLIGVIQCELYSETQS